MASIDKVKAFSVGRLFQHHNRTAVDGVNHSNESIDLTRTPLNTAYIQTAPHEVFQRIDHFYHMNRKNITVLEEAIVTLPQDVKEEDEVKFFDSCYAFYCNDFEVVNAVVHRDEKTPHIHIDFYPVKPFDREQLREERPAYLSRIEKYEEEKGFQVDGILCGKDVINRVYLQNMHPRLLEWVTNDLGYECEILNGATANGNRTVIEMKTEKKIEELNKISDSLDQKKAELETIQSALDSDRYFDKRYCNFAQIIAENEKLKAENIIYEDLLIENGIDIPREQESKIIELAKAIPKAKITFIESVQTGLPKDVYDKAVKIEVIDLKRDFINPRIENLFENNNIPLEEINENTVRYFPATKELVFAISNSIEKNLDNVRQVVNTVNSISERDFIYPSISDNRLDVSYLENVKDDKTIYYLERPKRQAIDPRMRAERSKWFREMEEASTKNVPEGNNE